MGSTGGTNAPNPSGYIPPAAPVTSYAPPASPTVPSLATAYTQAPDLVPAPPPGMSNDGSGTVTGVSCSPFYIDLDAARAHEQECLDATAKAVDGYETLKSTVTGAMSSSTIFGQEAIAPWAREGAYGSKGPVFDKLDQDGKDFAAKVDPQMGDLMDGIASVLDLMGHFNAALNTGFQMYVYTDFHNAFPATS